MYFSPLPLRARCEHAARVTRLLVWNLYHGRSYPEPSGRSLAREFSAALRGWEWELALLQEVPPWWVEPLARACGARGYRALTARNWLLGLRRAVSARNPDVLGSWGGGANAILVREPAGVAAVPHRRRTLRWLPERRVVHAVRTAGGLWVGNVHVALHPGHAARDVRHAARTLAGWAAGAPCVLAGDLNLREPPAPAGWTAHRGHWVDHVLARDAGVARIETLERGRLSDHRPLRVYLET